MESSLRVLTVSPMYPDALNQTFGIFIARLEGELLRRRMSEFTHAVRYKCAGSTLAELLSYTSWVCRAIGKGVAARFHIIHAHTVFPGGVVASAIGAIRHKPVVITVHGSDIVLLVRRSRVTRWLARLSLRRAAVVHAVSEYLRRRIVEFEPLVADKIVVQCMGVDAETFSTARCSRRSLKAFKLVFTGNLVEARGWRIAFETVRLLKLRGLDCVLEVYGDGADWARAARWITAQGLGSSIHMYGAKAPDVVAAALQEADLFLFPSQFDEGFGLAPAEALSCGLPVVVSGRGALPELVVSPACGVVVEQHGTKAEAYADACQLVLSQRRNAEPAPLLDVRHTLRRAAERLYDVYRDIKNVRRDMAR